MAVTRVGIAGSSAAYLPFLAKTLVLQIHPVLDLTVYATRETALTVLALPTEEQ